MPTRGFRLRHDVPVQAALRAKVKRRLPPFSALQMRERAVIALMRQGIAQRQIVRMPSGVQWSDGNGGMHHACLRRGKLHAGTGTRVHASWRFDLRVGKRHGYSGARGHPTFWLLGCVLSRPNQPGGILVIPDCVLPPHWVVLHIPQMAGSWLWRWWDRWDCFTTYPDVPEDLLS